MSVEQILEAVSGYPCRYVVLTGGEPMIAPHIEVLTRALEQRGFHITIETAGTVYRDVACQLMSISPKLSNSTPHGVASPHVVAHHERLRIQPDVLKKLMGSYNYQLKFVVQNPEDIEEVLCLVRQLNANPEKVLLMPEGVDRESVLARSKWIVEECKKYGFRYGPRLHIEIFGNQPGT